MRFGKAYYGVKKIFASEILQLLAAIIMSAATLIGLSSAGSLSSILNSNDASSVLQVGLGTIISLACSAILSLIAIILMLVGLGQAGHDASAFKTGFAFALIQLLLQIASAVLPALNFGGANLPNILQTVNNVLNLIIVLLIIGGIRTLAERLGNYPMQKLGGTTDVILVISIIMSVAASTITLVMQANTVTTSISGILSIVSAILMAVFYIVFLVYLGKAKTMLRNS